MKKLEPIMNRLLNTVYFWTLTYYVFWIFNGDHPSTWNAEVKLSCGLIMLTIAFVAHLIDDKKDKIKDDNE